MWEQTTKYISGNRYHVDRRLHVDLLPQIPAVSAHAYRYTQYLYAISMFWNNPHPEHCHSWTLSQWPINMRSRGVSLWRVSRWETRRLSDFRKNSLLIHASWNFVSGFFRLIPRRGKSLCSNETASWVWRDVLFYPRRQRSVETVSQSERYFYPDEVVFIPETLLHPCEVRGFFVYARRRLLFNLARNRTAMGATPGWRIMVFISFPEFQ